MPTDEGKSPAICQFMLGRAGQNFFYFFFINDGGYRILLLFRLAPFHQLHVRLLRQVEDSNRVFSMLPS